MTQGRRHTNFLHEKYSTVKETETVSAAWHAYRARAVESDTVLRAADRVASVGSRLTADKPTRLRSSMSSGSGMQLHTYDMSSLWRGYRYSHGTTCALARLLASDGSTEPLLSSGYISSHGMRCTRAGVAASSWCSTGTAEGPGAPVSKLELRRRSSCWAWASCRLRKSASSSPKGISDPPVQLAFELALLAVEICFHTPFMSSLDLPAQLRFRNRPVKDIPPQQPSCAGSRGSPARLQGKSALTGWPREPWLSTCPGTRGPSNATACRYEGRHLLSGWHSWLRRGVASLAALGLAPCVGGWLSIFRSVTVGTECSRACSVLNASLCGSSISSAYMLLHQCA